MNCNSRHSFDLYLKRFSSLVYKWILFLAEILQQQILEKTAGMDLKMKWNQLLELIKKLKINRISEISRINEVVYRFRFVHSVFSGHNMGLGP